MTCQPIFAFPPAGSAGTLSAFRSDAWFLPNDERLGFVEIPAGPFVMGSDAARDRLTMPWQACRLGARRRRLTFWPLSRRRY